MISKELLSAVFGIKIMLIEYDELRSSVSYYCNQFGNATGYINIHELAHKVKEWASTQGYYIVQDTRGFTKVAKYGTELRKFWEDDEFTPDRVFDCGQWILENKS